MKVVTHHGGKIGAVRLSRLVPVFEDDIAQLGSSTICHGHIHDVVFIGLAYLTNPLPGVQA